MIDVEKIERETSQVCFSCGERKSRFILREARNSMRRLAVDRKDRKWRDNKCPDCILEYKKNWARKNYREKVIDNKTVCLRSTPPEAQARPRVDFLKKGSI